MKIKPLHNKLFLKIELPKYKPELISVGEGIVDRQGKPLFLRRDEMDKNYAPQKGVIYFMPDKFTLSQDLKPYRNDVPLHIGDTVYHHHFATQDIFKCNINGEDLFWQEYNQIYAVERDGDVLPLERYVFIEQLKEKESDIITKSGIYKKSQPGDVVLTGTLRYLCPLAIKHGLKKGDIVKYKSQAQYRMKIGNEVLWKSRIDNLHAIME